MASSYTLTVYLVGGDRANIQDLTIRLFDAEWQEIRKSLVSSYTEKVRFRVSAGDVNLHVSFVRNGEVRQTPFWGFSVPQVTNVHLDMISGQPRTGSKTREGAIVQQGTTKKEAPDHVRSRFPEASILS